MMKGSDYIRLRVGDWRVIIDEHGDVLDIINIGARGGVYQ
jgi:mRNA interferase RelE/StbE